jgi:hypothetical protein
MKQLKTYSLGKKIKDGYTILINKKDMGTMSASGASKSDAMNVIKLHNDRMKKGGKMMEKKMPKKMERKEPKKLERKEKKLNRKY